MGETIFPQSPNWYSSRILTTRKDGSVAYGSLNDIFIINCQDQKKVQYFVINDAHSDRITGVVFSPDHNNEKCQNSLVSCASDGFVKLWDLNTLSPVKGHSSHCSQKDSLPLKVVCADWSHYSPHYVVSVAENDTVVRWNILANVTTKYFFPKLKPSFVAYSMHSKEIVGIGSKTGLIHIIKLTEKGETIHKLRGHDKEIQMLSWCPSSMGLSEKNEEEFLLASSSEEKEIYIWRTVDGVCESRIKLPKAPLSKGENKYRGKNDSGLSFTPIFWANTTILYSGTIYGELIFCNVKSYLANLEENENDSSNSSYRQQQPNKKLSDCWKLRHSLHSSMLLGIFGVPLSVQQVPNLEDNFEQQLNESSGRSRPLIWTVAKDQRLIAVEEGSDESSETFNLHTLNGHAYEAAVSPHDPNIIAVAVGDGKIRIWNATKLSGHAQMIRRTGNDRIYSLAWHPTKEGLLAFGTSYGRVGIVDIYATHQTWTFRVCHPNTVYRLAWGPPFSENSEVGSTREKFHLYSVGGKILFQHDPANVNADPLNLSKLLDFSKKKESDVSWKPDYTILTVGCSNGKIFFLKPPRLEVIHVLQACRKDVQSLVWHPNTTNLDKDVAALHGYFTFGSTDTLDPAVKVYNCFSEHNNYEVKQICALKGHSGYVQHVSWSPHVGGRLVSSGSDFSVRVWDVIMQTQLSVFFPCQSKLTLFCIWNPVDSDYIIAGCAARIAICWKVSTIFDKVPLVRENKCGKIRKTDMGELVNDMGVIEANKEPKFDKILKNDNRANDGEVNGFDLAKIKEANKKINKKALFKNAWRLENNHFKNCYDLLKGNGMENNSSTFTLPFFNKEYQLQDYLKEEEQRHQRADNWNESYELALWTGNIKDIITEKIKTGHLDDFLVSMASFVSPRLWQEACIAYSKSLAEKKMHRKAACYLMAIHKIYDAIDLLADEHLYLEAICIARCSLPESDPVLKKTVRLYADWLSATGSLLKACECLIYLEEYEEAAKILGRKNQLEYLHLAAIASKRAGDKDLEFDFATNALLLCLETLNFDLALLIIKDHSNLKHLSLLQSVHQVLHQLDCGEMTIKTDLISYIKEVSQFEQDPSLYSSLNYFYDKNAMYTDKKKLYVAMARELSLACCAVEKEVFLTHIIKALHASSRYVKCGENSVLYKLCSWLSSDNYFANNSIYCFSDINVQPKVISMRAFLCQGIVEHLDNCLNKNYDAAYQALEPILKRLIDDVFDKDTFNYFRDQVNVKACEKRLEEMRKNQKQNGNAEIKKNGESVNGVSVGVEVPKCCKSEINPEIFEDHDSMVAKYEMDEQATEECLIASEMDKRDKLNMAIMKFEKSRIFAPNPSFVYCILKRVCQKFCSFEEDKMILSAIEKKWLELELS